MIVFALDIPADYRPKATYAIESFSDLAGLPVRVVDHAQTAPVDVIYTSTPRPANGALTLPFDARAYAPANLGQMIQSSGGDGLWGCPRSDGLEFDLLGGIFRLLNFLDESAVSEQARNAMGVFQCDALPQARRAASGVPLVENNVQEILQRLLRRRPELAAEIIPKWPGGKSYALAVTHDTDAINIGAPVEVLANLARFILRRRKTHLKMFMAGLAHIGRPAGNPFWGFPAWRQFEQLHAMRSCFYLFAKTRDYRFHIRDCHSDMSDFKSGWEFLREMAAEGWEFGFHAPVNSRFSDTVFSQSRQLLQENLGHEIVGLRHHYWALDWRQPWQTFRRHAQGGFRYDCSITFRDKPGFRAGTCHPFRPYDPRDQRAMDFWELPTCLWDGPILTLPREQAVPCALEVLKTVQKTGGLAVLDWHTETACNRFEFEGYMTVFSQIMQALPAPDKVWLATPSQIVSHWQRRRAELLAGAGHRDTAGRELIR